MSISNCTLDPQSASSLVLENIFLAFINSCSALGRLTRSQRKKEKKRKKERKKKTVNLYVKDTFPEWCIPDPLRNGPRPTGM